jgi:predicted enzyme related to lactoylglutathione lyase
VTLSTTDAARLVAFYRGVTGDGVTFQAGVYTVIGHGEGHAGAALAFQEVAAGADVVPVHIDLGVDDIDAGGREVERLGGRLGAKHEEVGSVWQQAFDPDGNVFCLMARPPVTGPSQD